MFVLPDFIHVECVKVALEAGADVNSKDVRFCHTALIKATWKGHDKCVELLIQVEADVNK